MTKSKWLWFCYGISIGIVMGYIFSRHDPTLISVSVALFAAVVCCGLIVWQSKSSLME
jgi:hypothetical protein